MNSDQTRVPPELKDQIRKAIWDRLGRDLVREIELRAIDVDEDEEEIRFVVRLVIGSDEDAERLGKRFFGLTDKVRQALGKDWHRYFPILQTEIDHGKAA